MERPEWIGAALARGRGRAAQVRGLPGRLFGRMDAEKPAEPAEAPAKPAAEPASEGGPGLVQRVRERPTLAIACAAMALLVIVWIAWAIHVGSSNGGSAAVGVLITWPLFFLIVANLVLIGIGLTMLFRYLQPADGPATDVAPAPDGKASGEKTETKKGSKQPKGEEGESKEEGEPEASEKG